MEEIKCTSYEKREFIRLLEYAKEMKIKNKQDNLNKKGVRYWDDTNYDVQQIDILIKRIKGIPPEKNYIRDSLNATHENREEYEESNRQKYYYGKRSNNNGRHI